jgi:hypothetical protein
MKVFKSDVYVHNPKELWSKLDSKEQGVYVLLRYNVKSKSYKLWDKVHDEIVINKNVIFHEDVQVHV